MGRARIWMVGDYEPLREIIAEIGLCVGTPLDAMDRDEANGRLQSDGLPDAAILTDWDLKVAPEHSRTYVTGCPRVLVACSLPHQEIDHAVLDSPNVELIGMPFELEDLGAALAWLNGQNADPQWSGSKSQLQMVAP